jgi:hypothetical protein
MIPKEHRVELGTFKICRKGLNSFTLAAPKPWRQYSGAALGDECIALTDKRDNSLHFYLKKKIIPRQAATTEKAS